MSDVAVIGAGYVGMTTAACLARLGHRVTCADVNEERVAQLSQGKVPILEQGLPELVAEGLAAGRLRFVSAPPPRRVTPSSCSCVCRPRSPRPARPISPGRSGGARDRTGAASHAVVVNKSTMPVGSTLVVSRELARAGAPTDVGVASNPEFLREGQAVHDFLQPNRVVIGCSNTEVAVACRSSTPACRRRSWSPTRPRPR